MHGSILLVTIPLRPGHTPGDLQFFSFLEVYTLPLVTQKLRQFPTLELLIDLTYVFATVTSFLSIQKQNDTFSSQLLWTFSWVYWEKDNESVVKLKHEQ